MQRRNRRRLQDLRHPGKYRQAGKPEKELRKLEGQTQAARDYAARQEIDRHWLFIATVGRFRIEHALVAEFEGHRAGFAERHRAIKARAAAGVAGAGDLLDLDPDRILVAIDAPLDDALGVAAGLALLP